MVASWRRDFLNFLQLLPTLSVDSSTLGVSIPPHTHQCKKLKVAKNLPMFEVRLCKKHECCNKDEFRGESPNLCEYLTVWMEFLCGCVNDKMSFEYGWKSVKIEDFWRFRHLLEWEKMGEKRQISLKLWMISIIKIDAMDSQLRWLFCVWMEWILWKMWKELRPGRYNN